nr:hypothetical protein OG999_17690 [Streptomyces sp. NBC_00886]
MNAAITSTSGEMTILRIASLLAEAEQDKGDGSSYVVSFATLTEAHVDACLRHLFSASGVTENGLAKQMYTELQDSIYRTWDSRYKWLAQAFDVKVKGQRFEQDFGLLVELRNSIVHGGGHLTALQSAKVPQMIAIRSGLQRCLGLESHGRKFLLDCKIIVPAARICRDYIQGFDEAIKLKFPAFEVRLAETH